MIEETPIGAGKKLDVGSKFLLCPDLGFAAGFSGDVLKI